MSSLFSDEHKKIEVHFRESQSVFESYLRDQQFLLYPIKKTSGFIVPRTIATIVNEAYFALEERIATKTDIDRAMKFGVNYPKGPFEWAKDCKQAIVWTLEDLYSTTKDERYLISQLLKMEIK
jgi:3-hydroxybutyryl-CoA dehydrogenase